MESMSVSKITTVLNATLSSLEELLTITIGKVRLISAPVVQHDFGVLVGITGDLKGRLFVFGQHDVFREAGLSMYGIDLPEDLVESFVGEFGNSVAGRMATLLSSQHIAIDITPPTTMKGTVHVGGFHHALQVPFETERGSKGSLTLAMGT